MPALVLLLTLLLSAGCTRASTPDSVIAISNVNVVPMTADTVLSGQTVLVEHGTVSAVGSSLEIPGDAKRIDGQGRYLLPGLTDFHIHLRSTDELLSYLTHGVTTVVHVSGALRGAPDLRAYKDELVVGNLAGPTLYASGEMLDGDPPVFPGVSTVVRSPEEARRAVADQHKHGYDFIKVYNNLAPDVLEAAVAAAHDLGMAVIGHVPRKAGRAEALQAALAAGLDVIAHGEEIFFTYAYAGVDSMLDRGEAPLRDSALVAESVRMIAASGAAVTPNLSFVEMTRRQLDDFGAVLEEPEAVFLESEVRDMWVDQNPARREDLKRFDRRERAKEAFVQELTSALQAAGVPLLLGTDSSAPGMYPGASAHLELRELVEAGLTPYEALATGTRNAGQFISEHVEGAEPFGLVLPGYRADLVLVRDNPLSDVAHASDIEGVMVRGRWFTKDELEDLRAERAR